MPKVCNCIRFDKQSAFEGTRKCGVYETDYGNAAVSDGKIAYDLDMGQAIPVEFVNFSAWIRDCEDQDIEILEEAKEGFRGISRSEFDNLDLQARRYRLTLLSDGENITVLSKDSFIPAIGQKLGWNILFVGKLKETYDFIRDYSKIFR